MFKLDIYNSGNIQIRIPVFAEIAISDFCKRLRYLQ